MGVTEKIWGAFTSVIKLEERGIVADIELIRADEINEAYERMLKGDVKYRFVIDNASLTA